MSMLDDSENYTSETLEQREAREARERYNNELIKPDHLRIPSFTVENHVRWEEIRKLHLRRGSQPWGLDVLNFTDRWGENMEWAIQEGCDLDEIVETCRRETVGESPMGVEVAVQDSAKKILCEVWMYGGTLQRYYKRIEWSKPDVESRRDKIEPPTPPSIYNPQSILEGLEKQPENQKVFYLLTIINGLLREIRSLEKEK